MAAGLSSAFRWTAASSAVRGGLQAFQLIIIGRSLTADEFGLGVLAMAINTIALIVAEAGLGSALIQKSGLTQEARSILFWFALVGGIVISASIFLLAPCIAALYGNAQLKSLLYVAAINPPLTAVTTALRSIQERRLRFRRVVIVEIIASACAALTAVCSVRAGFGALSMILGTVVAGAVSVALAWIFLREGWLPRSIFRLRAVIGEVSFGFSVMLSNLINQISISMDVFLGARYLTSMELGLYSLPRNLILQFQMLSGPVLSRVTVPLVAGAQECDERLRCLYIHSLRSITILAAPVYVLFCLTGARILPVVFGDSWNESSVYMVPLGIWGYLRHSFNPIGSLLIGTGRGWLATRWNVVQVLVTVPLILLGAHYGGLAMAYALVFALLVMMPIAWAMMLKPICKVGVVQFGVSLLLPPVIAIVSAVPAWVHLEYTVISMGSIVMSCVLTLVLYAGLSISFAKWFLVPLQR